MVGIRDVLGEKRKSVDSCSIRGEIWCLTDPRDRSCRKEMELVYEKFYAQGSCCCHRSARLILIL